MSLCELPKALSAFRFERLICGTRNTARPGDGVLQMGGVKRASAALGSPTAPDRQRCQRVPRGWTRRGRVRNGHPAGDYDGPGEVTRSRVWNGNSTSPRLSTYGRRSASQSPTSCWPATSPSAAPVAGDKSTPFATALAGALGLGWATHWRLLRVCMCQRAPPDRKVHPHQRALRAMAMARSCCFA